MQHSRRIEPLARVCLPTTACLATPGQPAPRAMVITRSGFWHPAPVPVVLDLSRAGGHQTAGAPATPLPHPSAGWLRVEPWPRILLRHKNPWLE